MTESGWMALFSGQGAQTVGMGKTAGERYPAARRVLQEAEGVLGTGFGLSRVMREGPVETLNLTSYAQPALYVTCLALAAALDEKLPGWRTRVRAAAGLSLGEFTALAFAGSLSFADGLKLVALRGKLMQEACDTSPGSMLSCIGLSRREVEEILPRVPGQGPLVAANINSLTQIVLSGSREKLDQAAPLLQEKGARVMPLKVAGAFHSPLMASALPCFREAVAAVTVAPPSLPVYLNVLGKPFRDPAVIKKALVDQLTQTVEWWPSMEAAWQDGFRRFLEIGPGAILTGMLKRGLDKSLLPEAFLVSWAEGTEEVSL